MLNCRQSLNKHCILTLLSGLAIGFTVAYVALSQQITITDPHSSYELDFLDGPTVDPGSTNLNSYDTQN